MTSIVIHCFNSCLLWIAFTASPFLDLIWASDFTKAVHIDETSWLKFSVPVGYFEKQTLLPRETAKYVIMLVTFPSWEQKCLLYTAWRRKGLYELTVSSALTWPLLLRAWGEAKHRARHMWQRKLLISQWPMSREAHKGEPGQDAPVITSVNHSPTPNLLLTYELVSGLIRQWG